MKLYQWVFGHQPHFVVAQSYAEAEETIQRENGPFHPVKKIELIGEYVLLGRSVMPDEDET